MSNGVNFRGLSLELRKQLTEVTLERDELITRLRAAERDAGLYLLALQKIAAIEDRYNCGDWDEIEEARDIANAAMSREPNL